MSSEISFFSKGIILNNLKRFGLIGLLYTYILIFAAPMGILFDNATNSNSLFFDESNIFLTLFLALIFSVSTSIAIFRYMHVKNPIDIIHSLPIKRAVLYRSNILSGCIILTLPVFLISLSSWIMSVTFKENIVNTLPNILEWFLLTSLINVLVFLFCSTVGLVVGRSYLQGIFTYMLLAAPLVLAALIEININILANGFDYTYFVKSTYPWITRLTESFTTLSIFKVTLIILFLCILIYITGKSLYINSKIETVGQAFTCKIPHFFFKYYITFSSSLLMGLLFSSQIGRGYYWVSVGYILGSILGYFAVCLLLRKSVLSSSNLREFRYYTAIIILALIIIRLNVTGYEKRIPDSSEISSVYFNHAIISYSADLSSADYHFDDVDEDKINIYYEPANIKIIESLHNELIKQQLYYKYSNLDLIRKFVFKYNLKDGSTFKRVYYAPCSSYSGSITIILQSREYKQSHFDVLNIDSKDLREIVVTSGSVGKFFKISNPSHIKEAVAILSDEVNKESYNYMYMEELNASNGLIVFEVHADKTSKYPKLSGTNPAPSYMIREKSYTKFENWLKKEGYIEN